MRFVGSSTLYQVSLGKIQITFLYCDNLLRTLEALAVDDGGSTLVVLLLRDPHLLEGG